MEVENRRDVVATVKHLQESLCGECEVEIAVVDCEDCHESYCKMCCEYVHKKGRRKQHTNFTKIQICGQCEVVAATKECLDCQEYYCEPCCGDVHSRGQRVKHKHIRKIDTSQFRAVNYDQSNAFGLITKQLVFSRFASCDAEYNEHLEKVHALCTSVTQECRKEEKPYVDTEPATLEVPKLARPQQISMQIQTDAVMEQLEEELERSEEAREKKQIAIKEILSNVYSWRRPRQFTEFPSLFSAGNTLLASRPAGSPVPHGFISYLPFFKKGILDDHYFLLALSAVATRQQLVANLFVSCENADVGMYTFQFYRDSEMGTPGWHPITIDHLTPCGKNREPVFGATDDPNELWAILLEKAYAKFLGAYTHLHYGDSARTLMHLTGGVPEVEAWNSKTLSDDTKRKLWWKISQAYEQGMLVLCMKRGSKDLLHDVFTSESSRLEVPDDDIIFVSEDNQLNWDNGDVVQLTCDIVVGQRERKRNKLLKLRNVFGETTWTGAWSDASTLWTKEMRDLTSHKQVDDHITWMDLDDFSEQYDTVCILTTHRIVPDPTHLSEDPPQAFMKCIPSEEGYGMLPCYAHQYCITAADPKTNHKALEGDFLIEGADMKDKMVCNSAVHSRTQGELYVAPDWKDNEDVGNDEIVNVAKESLAERGAYTLHITVSQPELGQGYTGTGDPDPVEFDVLIFRSQEKGLQKPAVPESAEGEEDDDMNDYKAGKYCPSRTWTFPTHNQLQLQEHTAGKQGKQFTHTFSIVLIPGTYAVAITKKHPNDVFHYRVAFQGKDDAAQPTGFTMVAEHLGTLMLPLEDACASKEAAVISPRLMIQAAKQQTLS